MTILDGTPQSPRHRAGPGEQRPTVTQLLRSNPVSNRLQPPKVVESWNPPTSQPGGRLASVPPVTPEPTSLPFVLEPPSVPTPRFEDLLRELDREPVPPAPQLAVVPYLADVQNGADVENGADLKNGADVENGADLENGADVENGADAHGVSAYGAEGENGAWGQHGPLVQNVYSVQDAAGHYSAVQNLDAAQQFAAVPYLSGPDLAPQQPWGEQPQEGADRPRGGIVTVFSPKGGAGTTFVAVNLALLLGDHGRRRVCLVDADLQFGDVAIMAGLAPNRTMVDIVGRDLTDPEAAAGLVAQLVTPWTGGVDTLLAPVDPSAAEQVTPEVMTAVLLTLRSMYDYVVVDTPSQLSEHVVEALEIADRQILVCTAEVAALKNMRLVLDTLNLLGHGPARRSVVLNCTDAARPLGHADVEEAIVHPVAAAIPYGVEVSASVDDAHPLVLGRAEHPVAAALRRFTSDVITGEVQPVRKRGLLGGRLTKGRTAR